MEILWEEESFQFGFKRWQGWAVSKVLWEWIPNVGSKARENCGSHEPCVCIVGFPACGCQKKSVVYEMECRHAAVRRGKQDQNHLPSTTPSLNKGCPPSEIHVSRMPKLHSTKTNKTSYASWIWDGGYMRIDGLRWTLLYPLKGKRIEEASLALSVRVESLYTVWHIHTDTCT